MNAEALSALIDDRPGDGVFRVHRAIFDDPSVFEMELRHIFESGWVFLGLASQAPAAHDFFTTTIGRVPILVMRDGDGALGGFVNSCPHRGAQIAQRQCGNARLHVCAYHSWSFDSAGRNRAVKWEKEGCYTDAFRNQSHDLARLPAFGEYRGFLFGSLTAGVVPLAEHLGEAAKLLDLVADQGEDGVELVPGGVAFTYEGNWKLQLENCSDAYHFTSVHPSYIRLLDRRKSEAEATRSVWENNRNWSEESEGRSGRQLQLRERPCAELGRDGRVRHDAALRKRRHDRRARGRGEARLDVQHAQPHHLSQHADRRERFEPASRHPARFPRTGPRCAPGASRPKARAPNARRLRIRQYEDFFNPSGMATPDDTVAYENCQRGFAARVEPWLQGYCRGMAASRDGGNAYSERIDMTPARSVLADAQLCDETLFHSYYREWARRMAKALAP